MSIDVDSPALNPKFCVAGLVYFEVFLPDMGCDVALGEEVFAEHIDIGLGGALNGASVSAALGIDTTIAYPGGHGLTDAAVASELDKLPLSTITWAAEDDPAISLVRSQDGDRGFVSRADFDALSDGPPLPRFDWVHVPGLEEAHRLQGQLDRARDRGTTVSVSGSWAPERLDALRATDTPRWDLLILNKKEARRASSTDTDSASELVDDLRTCAGDIIITDGPRQVVARIDDQKLQVDVTRAEDFVDATGAGDAFSAGYIAARLRGLGPSEAIAYGADVAACVVAMRGGVVEDRATFSELEDPLL